MLRIYYMWPAGRGRAPVRGGTRGGEGPRATQVGLEHSGIREPRGQLPGEFLTTDVIVSGLPLLAPAKGLFLSHASLAAALAPHACNQVADNRSGTEVRNGGRCALGNGGGIVEIIVGAV